MNRITNIWDWLSGKKTLLGAGVEFIVGVIALAQTTFGFVVLSADQLSQVREAGLWIIAVGFAHKVVKSETVQNRLK